MNDVGPRPRSHSAKVVPATVSFVDIAGIVRGASEGEDLSNQFLANIREADAICMVTRAFDDPDVTHVDGKIDPAGDIETIATELILGKLERTLLEVVVGTVVVHDDDGRVVCRRGPRTAPGTGRKRGASPLKEVRPTSGRIEDRKSVV